MELSNTTKALAGIILITVPTIEFGGTFLLGMVAISEPGYSDNPLRRSLFRAGHAHAGVLVILSLVTQLYVDSLPLGAGVEWAARLGAPLAAILMPLGFFLCVVSPNARKPNGMIALVYAGAAALAVSTIVLGVALVRAA
jgi:hypothetical protein